MGKNIEVPILDHDLKMAKEFGHKVSQDGKLERRIVAALIDHMEQKGFRVTGVWDGEVWEKTDTAKQAMEFIFNLDDCSLRFVAAEGYDRDKHEKTRKSYNAYASKEHGVYLVLGNGSDIISAWNYNKADGDRFNAAMESFNTEDYE